MENIKITKLDHQGRGIGKINEKVVFIENAYPEEIVNIKITKEQKNFSEALVVEHIQKSKNRIESICKHYPKCGGCTFIDLDYEEQLKYKENKVKEIIEKEKITTLIKPIIKCDNQFYYRNKASFQINKIIGYYRNKTYQIEEIEKCYIVNERINELLNILNKTKYQILKKATVRYSEHTNELMLILDNHLLSNDIDTLIDCVDTIIVERGNKHHIIHGSGFITEKIGNYIFKISPSAFFQVNTKQTKFLYNKVLEYASPTKQDILLDLYCGTGTIGLYLSKHCKKVIGVELNKDAIKDAKENAKLNNIENIEFIASDTNNINNLEKENPSIIIVDPPRSGLTNQVINYLTKTKPTKIVYVSCDPHTLMRDLKQLEVNYTIEEITPVDMFPNTYHVECVALLVLKK